MDFVHLHTHSEYSILDSTCKIDALLLKAKECDMPALALTDHGVMSGALEFYRKAQGYGVKPIIGSELYVAPGNRFDKRVGKGEKKYHHLLVLVENERGYRNLLKLVSLGYIEGFYYKPRVDLELLRRYHDGLIAASGCKSGEIPRLVVQGRTSEAEAKAKELREIFGVENLFIEIQNHGLEEELPLIEQLKALAKRLSLPVVATNDVHYLEKEDREAHEVLLNIQANKTLYDEDRRIYEGEEYYFRSQEEMWEFFKGEKEALENTVKIAERCNLKLEFGSPLLPSYDLPSGYDGPNAYLEELTLQGARERYDQIDDEIEERLRYELSVIEQMGYATYFLIVQDFVKFAKKQGIPVGPGRGTAAGSLVSYCLGITNIDPLKYGLLFERFLNPERVSPPDIDIDFCMKRRDEVIRYVEESYGRDRVAQIVTFDTMAARSAIRDVARVLGTPYGEADRIAKMIPFGSSLSEAVNGVRELKRLYQEKPETRRLIDISKKLEGLVRNPSTHAAGVVIAPDKLIEFVPLQRLSDGAVVTQYNMKDLETIGMLKMDFLGLRNLTIIDDTLRSIREAKGREVEVNEIPLDDPATYRLLREGRTAGVFQLEGTGIRELLRRLEPAEFKDIIALLALYRPGPLESGMAQDFVERKQGRQEISYPHPDLKEILAETYGLPIYQEQLLNMARVLAGFTLGEADLLRKAIGKKDKRVMQEVRERFINGCLENDIPVEKALSLFSSIEKFARYGFAKSHSTAYALISYWTAFLKTHYPTHYMAALLTSVSSQYEKVAEYVQECRDMGIMVLPPDINESGVDFTAHDGRIRFGLAAIKHVGKGAVLSILEARDQGGEEKAYPFSSFVDFCRRVDPQVVNREALENLIKAGAFDRFSTRKALLDQVGVGLELAQRVQLERRSGQRSFFTAEEELPQISAGKEGASQRSAQFKCAKHIKRAQEEFPQEMLLNFEKDLLGLYVSSHPLLKYKDQLSLCRSCSLNEIDEARMGKALYLGGRIDGVRVITTSNAKRMAFVKLEDLKGKVDVTVFPDLYEQRSELLREDKLIFLIGKAERRSGRIQVVADEIHPLEEADRLVELHLLLPVELVDNHLVDKLRQIFESHQGETPVFLHVEGGARDAISTYGLPSRGSKKELIKVGRRYSVRLSRQMMEEMKGILGEGGVKLRRRPR